MKLDFGFCFRPVSERDDCSGPLMLWIDYRDRTCFVPTVFDVRHDEWDPVSGTLVLSGKSPERRRLLAGYACKMDRTLRAVRKVIADLETARAARDLNFTAARIARVIK